MDQEQSARWGNRGQAVRRETEDVAAEGAGPTERAQVTTWRDHACSWRGGGLPRPGSPALPSDCLVRKRVLRFLGLRRKRKNRGGRRKCGCVMHIAGTGH